MPLVIVLVLRESSQVGVERDESVSGSEAEKETGSDGQQGFERAQRRRTVRDKLVGVVDPPVHLSDLPRRVEETGEEMAKQHSGSESDSTRLDGLHHLRMRTSE